ncbi:MAG TPA: hypothetical protein VM425_07435 [Myxococcota bacterium]|nr:hypothetical protein [Myxococcota bacterium]
MNQENTTKESMEDMNAYSRLALIPEDEFSVNVGDSDFSYTARPTGFEGYIVNGATGELIVPFIEI